MSRRVRRARRWRCACLPLVVGLLFASALPAAADTVSYRPPVDAPVADPFRAPAHRYAAGNRGIDYATSTDMPVRAAADGEVIFAGPVAGTLHVTVLHADGLRTSYSFLDRVEVSRGMRVAQGDAVGTASASTHFGVRDAQGEYLDPQLLFDGAVRMRVRLVPGADEGEAPLVAAERRALLRLVLERGLELANASRVDVLAHYAVELRLDVRTARILWRLADQAGVSCTPAGDVPPVPSGRVAVLVGGLGSTSTQAAIDRVDTDALGFGHADVVRFSYAGGRVPDPTDDERYRGIAAREYEARDTTGDFESAAERLADLLVAMAAARPGVPIDVIGHSLGGVVARLALAEAGARGRLPAEVATLVTLGSPHAGADLATAAVALDGRVGLATPRALETVVGIPPDAPAV
ncbi:MAG TPA: peptidoglycan DD-metalloendopeptidase family protein, partial [Acidimicrobiia bacterium]|nr:peptidoglycan DD-metalloendopeptidase family protein [Acidimicrobiia bacterium]